MDSSQICHDRRFLKNETILLSLVDNVEVDDDSFVARNKLPESDPGETEQPLARHRLGLFGVLVGEVDHLEEENRHPVTWKPNSKKQLSHNCWRPKLHQR